MPWASPEFKARKARGEEGEVGCLHLLFQLGLGQQLWDEVQTDMDGGDACNS